MEQAVTILKKIWWRQVGCWGGSIYGELWSKDFLGFYYSLWFETLTLLRHKSLRDRWTGTPLRYFENNSMHYLLAEKYQYLKATRISFRWYHILKNPKVVQVSKYQSLKTINCNLPFLWYDSLLLQASWGRKHGGDGKILQASFVAWKKMSAEEHNLDSIWTTINQICVQDQVLHFEGDNMTKTKIVETLLLMKMIIPKKGRGWQKEDDFRGSGQPTQIYWWLILHLLTEHQYKVQNHTLWRIEWYVVGMAQWDAAAGRVRQVIVAKVVVDEIIGDDDDDTSVPMNEDSLFSIDRKLKALGLVGNLWKRWDGKRTK